MRTESVSRALKLAIGLLLVVPLAVLLRGGPAVAAEAAASCYFNNLPVQHGEADWGVATQNCYVLNVIDAEPDGHGVRAEFYTSQDYTMRTVRDSNGSSEGYGVWSDGVHYVTNFRVCESTKGCTKWVKEIYPP
jgi:hypothetical protein